MLEIRATTRFKKEVKKAARQQKEMHKLGVKRLTCWKLKNPCQQVFSIMR